MDWSFVIDRQRTALLRLVAGMFAVVGMAAGEVVETVPRALRSRVLRVLRAADSATRRLIFIAARDLAVPTPTKREAPTAAIPKRTGQRVPAFRLFDPRKDFKPHTRKYAKHGPRISFFDEVRVAEPVPPQPSPDDPMSAARICGRLRALKAALDDLPRQARRLVRAQARHRFGVTFRPMRPGRPPGHRARRTHVVDEILAQCQELALLSAVEPVDTS